MLKILFDPRSCQGYVVDRNSIKVLEERWFGRRNGDKLILSLEEVAYLILRKEVVVQSNNHSISSFSELMKEYENCFGSMFWPRLIIYNDLRSRGRKIKILDERLYLVKHKDSSLKLVLVLEEKSLIGIKDLLYYIEQARKNNLDLALAIVSLQGDITYYTVSLIDLMRG